VQTREELTVDKPMKFNGGLIKMHEDGKITLTQERHCRTLRNVDPKNTATSKSSRGIVKSNLTPRQQYVNFGAKGRYISSVCHPQVARPLAVAAQATEPGEDDMKALNKALQWQMDNADKGLTFVELDEDSLRVIVFADAAFANNKDLSSQLGLVIILADAHGNANIVHYLSVKARRVTRSTFAAELYAVIQGFDIGSAINSTLRKIIHMDIPLILATDSKSLYDCFVRLGTVTEKRLMIDIMAMRQAYERREVAEVVTPRDATTTTFIWHLFFYIYTHSLV
jgi:hypothetical protein